MKFKELREKYKSKYPAALVAAAVKIAIDMGGAMTPAVKKIEAMKRGLSDDPIVKDALRMANESVQEGMSPADKKKRLEMIKKAVEKLNAKNDAKAKADFLKQMKDMVDESVKEESIEEAKAPKAKGLNIYGSEISGLKNKKGRPHTVKPIADKGKLAFRVTDEFGSFKTVDLKTFAKEFG
jgi:hypothetical protein